MKYSIVTCTYNAEQHISKYFENVEAINYNDFEIIVVDDSSSDSTYLKLTEYAEKASKKVRIYRHENNQGPGIARNTGLHHITGSKVVFIDVDDDVDKEIFRFLDVYYEYDIVIYDYYKKYHNNVCKQCSTLRLSDGRIEDMDKVLMNTNGSVWGKMFDAKIIKNNNICFPKILKSEDLVFLTRYLSFCKTVYYLKQPLYYYTISPTSLVHRNVENQVKYAYEAITHIRNLNISDKAKLVFYCREIIYDLTVVYLKLGKNRTYVNEFWSNEQLPQNWQSMKNCFSRVHYLFLLLIEKRCYYTLKMLVRIKNRLS